MVRTDGPDGKLADFEIKYTFGVKPLQQYLVELPGGRLQALSIAWDARPREAGGQRWFHLYPNERIDFRDELHWTRRQQNWNYMCADCHSTNRPQELRRRGRALRHDVVRDQRGLRGLPRPGLAPRGLGRRSAAGRSYDRTDDKGLTVRLARAARCAVGHRPAASGNARRERAPDHRASSSSVCAQCHARRSQISSDYTPGPAVPRSLPFRRCSTEPLYWSDGQQRDEVYSWGSFLESRMHAAGVTCSDCHEPHSQTLRAPGNQVCAHATRRPSTTRARITSIAPAAAGAACAACHMPTTAT